MPHKFINIDNLSLKTDLGQHLTIDNKVVSDLIKAAEINRNDSVVEVGAGTGIITEILCQKAQKVITYEIDQQFFPYLEKLMKKYSNLEVKIENILETKIDFSSFKLVGNIPYHIVEPLLWQIRLNRPLLAAFIVPKKFAYRLTTNFTKEKVGSDLPLIFQSRFEIELLKNYPKESFYPAPKVNSSLIRFKPRDLFHLKNDFLRFIIAYLFEHKESKLKNGLREGLITYFKVAKDQFLSKKQAKEMIRKSSIDQDKLEEKIDGSNLFQIIGELKRLIID